jgi:hypothetical protein
MAKTRNEAGTLRDEGAAFLDFLEDRGITQIRLAREMGKSSTSMGRYVEQLSGGNLSDEIWFEIVQALRRLDVEIPAGLRTSAPRDPMSDRAALLAKAALFTTRAQLEALIELCDSNRDAQAFFRTFVAGRLAEMP